MPDPTEWIRCVKTIIRPSTDIRFVDTPLLGDFVEKIHELSINFSVTYSEDMLTRTKIDWYPAVLQFQIDVITQRYWHLIQADIDRRTQLGCKESWNRETYLK